MLDEYSIIPIDKFEDNVSSIARSRCFSCFENIDWGTLHIIIDPSLVLNEMKRIVKEDGKVLTNPPIYHRKISKFKSVCEVRLKDLYKGGGLKLIDVAYLVQSCLLNFLIEFHKIIKMIPFKLKAFFVVGVGRE
jgi:hypothetical protein